MTKIFLTGATGAIGARLTPMLVENGYDVVAVTRSPAKQDALRALGATPIVADGLDREGMLAAVEQTAPDVIVHQMTALTGVTFTDFERELETTNRLRTEGVDTLIATRVRVIAQSYGQWRYLGPGPLHTEDEQIDPDMPASMVSTADAVRHLESAVTAAGGTALRYGLFHGPGTGFEHLLAMPIFGEGTGVWSFAHIDDAAAATLAAIENDVSGVFNIADDEPLPVAEWLPALAPSEPARLPLEGAPESFAYMHNRIQGISNEKAKRELGWSPRHSLLAAH
ncbi:MAG TPA: NAD(P)-dependent oxidoreductase [Solirubrobacter sp.]|nr:NAD(P)-dependent oxidoreductase [Solirubrobacter sp.]